MLFPCHCKAEGAMNIASISANTVNTSTVKPVVPVKAEPNGQDPGAQAPAAAPTARQPIGQAPIASQLAPATVRALFNEASRAALPPGGASSQVVTAPAPAIAPLAAGLVASLAAQKTGRRAPAEPTRAGRTERKAARGAADPAKTVSENLSPDMVAALIQTAQKHRDDREEGGLLV
jgi:hypothetical protein